MAKVDIRLMGVRSRAPLIASMLRDLQTDESIVTYDDRPVGGDPLYTARKAWLQPLPAGTTHRLVLQDDLELCDNFTTIVTQAADAFPDAVFGLFNPRIRARHRTANSPYVSIPGSGVYSPAMMMPAPLIQPCFAWIAASLPSDYPFDDGAVGHFCRRHNITVLTTVPSTVQHLRPSESLIGLSNKDKVSKVWQGRTLHENWDSRAFSVGPYMGSRDRPPWSDIVANHGLEPPLRSS